MADISVPQRPHSERIKEILDTRSEIARQIRRYRQRRDFLQLCAEIDALRGQITQHRIDHPPFGSPELG